MIAASCSMKILSGIPTFYSHNLPLRAADVMLKDRRPLVLLVRETPLHLGHLRLPVRVTEIGAVAMPIPAFYHHPLTLRKLWTRRSIAPWICPESSQLRIYFRGGGWCTDKLQEFSQRCAGA
jgi:polyprenyl P-hydroxybenzoate/phenylacrylic acid decarboxylase-like protein